jgi:hypothetical protein
VFFLDFSLYRTYQAVGATHANFGIAAHPCNALSAGPDQVHSGVMTVIFASWWGASESNISSEQASTENTPGPDHPIRPLLSFQGSMCEWWIPPEKSRYRNVGIW